MCIISLKLNMQSNLREELKQISTHKDNVICTSELHHLMLPLSIFDHIGTLFCDFSLYPPPPPTYYYYNVFVH